MSARAVVSSEGSSGEGSLASSLPQLLVSLRCWLAVGTTRQLMTWQLAASKRERKGEREGALPTQATVFSNKISEVISVL